MHRPDAARALEGITCAVKDEVSVKDQPNTNVLRIML
jgi:Asp-tRNA(Asn)/Glu-tRNA(Gln) amidotransferase A subunit family amidase